MGDEIRIRAARDDELDTVAALTVEAYAQYAATMAPDAWSMFAQGIANVRARTTDGRLLVAERDGAVVGAVTVFLDWRGAQSDAASVSLLAVPPHFRGEGIGRVLMDHCVTWARDEGKRRVVITVAQEMEVARDLTESMGFTRAPELDHEPAPGVRLLGYALQLDAAADRPAEPISDSPV